MNHEYDDIDRALFALPLEEPPQDLRRSILAITVHAPIEADERPALWESLAAGFGLVAAAVLVWAVIRNPAFGVQIASAFMTLGRGFTNQTTLAGLTAGCSAVAWVSLMTLRPARVEVRSARS
jgi:hypothetical protein